MGTTSSTGLYNGKFYRTIIDCIENQIGLSVNLMSACIWTVLLTFQKCPYTCQGQQVCDTVYKPAKVSRFMDRFTYIRKVSINLLGSAGL